MKINKVLINKNMQLALLKELAQPVFELYYIGDTFTELLHLPAVAIVGSRKITPYGRSVTAQLASDLARAGIVIVSGLALGVDSIAHQAAIDAGGKTIAILPCGLHKIYPATHRNLGISIIQHGGALISEYPADNYAPQKYQFIARNRIIAALSKGIVITESAARGGSLHTADFALEQGKEVFAVPGNITSTMSEGANNLIKVGAHPVTSYKDIIQILNITLPHTTESLIPKDPSERRIVEILTQKPCSSAELVIRIGLSASEMSQALTMLEIQGLITVDVDQYWHVIK